jgi:hypothetical protein
MTAEGDDGVSAANGPEHTGLFQTGADDSFAAAIFLAAIRSPAIW